MSAFEQAIRIGVLASFAWVSSPALGSGGGIAGATEFTQLANNAELLKVAADGAVTAQKNVQQYMTQLEQFNLQKLNIKALEALPPGLATDALKAYQDLGRFQSAMGSLSGSLQNQARVMEQRMAEARLGGMNWNTYMARVAWEAAAGQKRAVERLRYEESVIKQVQSDYDFARTLQDKIPAAVGQQQSLQILNTQMNRVVTQNAKLLEVVSQSINKQAREDAEKAEAASRELANQELIRQRQEAIDARRRAFGGWQ